MKGYKTKDSVVIAYTGEGKGKTSASLGLIARALGAGHRVAFIQFIKHWEVGEHAFLRDIQPVYKDNLDFCKGGKGFFDAGAMSAKDVSDTEHKQAALNTYNYALEVASSGEYDLIVCDEINNAVHDGLLSRDQLQQLIDQKHKATSICLTGRNFPDDLLDRADIATDMQKLRHHFDDKFLANKGIDY